MAVSMYFTLMYCLELTSIFEQVTNGDVLLPDEEIYKLISCDQNLFQT